MKITLTYIKQSEKIRRLKHPIFLTVEFDDNGDYILSNNNFNLLATSPTLEEALTAITEEFNQLWETYVMCKNTELTGGGLKFREKLKKLDL